MTTDTYLGVLYVLTNGINKDKRGQTRRPINCTVLGGPAAKLTTPVIRALIVGDHKNTPVFFFRHRSNKINMSCA